MNTLLREHLVLICSQLSGDDYLSLACTCSALKEKLNEELFLRDVMCSTGYPFLVVEAAFYSYCYSQHFVSRRDIRNDCTFVEVLRRTFHSNKMTLQGIDTLKRWLCKKMRLVIINRIGTLDTKSLNELGKVYRICLKHHTALAQEIYDFAIYTNHPPFIVDLKLTKDAKVQRIKNNDVQWFRENTTDDTLGNSYFMRATRYNHQELMLLFIEKHGPYMFSRTYPYFPLYNYFLHPAIDAQSMAIILAFFPSKEYRVRIAEYLVSYDNLRAFEVLYKYYLPRLRNDCGRHSFKSRCLVLCLKHDAINCFLFIANCLNIDRLRVMKMAKTILQLKAYKIQRYCGIEDTLISSVAYALLACIRH